MKGKTVPLWSKIAKYVAISISLILGILIIIVVIIGAFPATPEQPQPPTLENCQDVHECLALKIPTRSGTDVVHGTITEVIDGDTIIHSAAAIVRLALVNSPERGEPGYQEAMNFTSDVCPVGEKAQVRYDDLQMSRGDVRKVGLVFCGGFLLNEALLTEGHAEILTYFCDKSEYGNTDWARAYGC